MDNNNKYQQEVDLKDLLLYLLRKWRPIILIACLLAIALGSYKVGSGLFKLQNEKFVTKAQDEYQKELDLYERTKVSLNREITNIMADIDAQDEYLKNSILMQIRPYDKYLATADVFIKTDYEIMPGMQYQNVNYTGSILKYYASAITTGIMIEDIAKTLGIENRYLQELITVDTDYVNGMLTISVAYMDEKNCNRIMNLLLQTIHENYEKVEHNIGVHTVNVMNQHVSSMVDTELGAQQQAKNNNVNVLQTTLADKKAELKGVEKPLPTGLSKKTLLMSGIKYAILGGVLGAFMVIFFLCLGFLMSDKITSSKELKNSFGLNMLGVLNLQKEKRAFAFVDLWWDKLEGLGTPVAEQSIYEVIAANVKNYADTVHQVHHILITGTVDPDVITMVSAKLEPLLDDAKLVMGGNMTSSASTLRKLPKCDGVIFVEMRGFSTYLGVWQELETVENVGKEVIGCVIL